MLGDGWSSKSTSGQRIKHRTQNQGLSRRKSGQGGISSAKACGLIVRSSGRVPGQACRQWQHPLRSFNSSLSLSLSWWTLMLWDDDLNPGFDGIALKGHKGCNGFLSVWGTAGAFISTRITTLPQSTCKFKSTDRISMP